MTARPTTGARGWRRLARTFPERSDRLEEGQRHGVRRLGCDGGNDDAELEQRAVDVALEREPFELGDLSAEAIHYRRLRRAHTQHFLDARGLGILVVADELFGELFPGAQAREHDLDVVFGHEPGKPNQVAGHVEQLDLLA